MIIDDSISLLLKMEINRLIQFYNMATISQKSLIKKQLKLIQLLLKINQLTLRRACKQNGHFYTEWQKVPSFKIFYFQRNKKKYKLVRICPICGHYEIKKNNKLLQKDF